MDTTKADTELVAYCGLFCGACRKLLSGRCPGCRKNEKASWCSVRTCCIDRAFSTCAECSEHPLPVTCSRFNNFMAKLFGLLFRSDRAACIARIRADGIDEFAAFMAARGSHTIKKA